MGPWQGEADGQGEAALLRAHHGQDGLLRAHHGRDARATHN